MADEHQRTELERQVVAELRLVARLSNDLAAALDTIRLPEPLGMVLLKTYQETCSSLRAILDTCEDVEEKAKYHELIDQLARDGLLPPNGP